MRFCSKFLQKPFDKIGDEFYIGFGEVRYLFGKIGVERYVSAGQNIVGRYAEYFGQFQQV